MKSQDLVLKEERFYGMLSFLDSNAYLMPQGEEFDELHSSLCLMDAANRLIKYAIENDELEDESWADLFSEEGDQGLGLSGKDNKAFIEFINNSTHLLVKEMQKREKECILSASDKVIFVSIIGGKNGKSDPDLCNYSRS